MSISHKAYLFDFAGFRAELEDILYDALTRDDVAPLREFINRNRSAIRDPYTGAVPLRAEWEGERASNPNVGRDVQWYAHRALLKYYDVTDDWGLDYGFDALSAYFESVPALAKHTGALICGFLFGPKGRRLDPGLMGTGLVPPAEVRRLLKLLERKRWPKVPEPDSPVFADCHYEPDSADEVRENRDRLVALYRQASAENKGILFEDFNDCGVSDQ